MKEPILSREEAFMLAQRFEATEDNDNIPGVVALTPLELEQFVSAILEKLCGEPIPYGYEFLDMAGTNHFVRGSLPAYAQSEIVPLYTLNRSKA